MTIQGREFQWAAPLRRAWEEHTGTEEYARNALAVRSDVEAHRDGAIYSAFMRGFIAGFESPANGVDLHALMHATPAPPPASSPADRALADELLLSLPHIADDLETYSQSPSDWAAASARTIRAGYAGLRRIFATAEPSPTPAIAPSEPSHADGEEECAQAILAIADLLTDESYSAEAVMWKTAGIIGHIAARLRARTQPQEQGERK